MCIRDRFSLCWLVVSQDIRSVLRMTIEEEEEEEQEQEQEQQQLLLWLSYGNNSKPVSLLELAADDDEANLNCLLQELLKVIKVLELDEQKKQEQEQEQQLLLLATHVVVVV